MLKEKLLLRKPKVEGVVATNKGWVAPSGELLVSYRGLADILGVEDTVVEPVVNEEVEKNEGEVSLEAAIAALDTNDESHWAYFGQNRQIPDLDKIEELTGKRYKVKEVKEAYKKAQ